MARLPDGAAGDYDSPRDGADSLRVNQAMVFPADQAASAILRINVSEFKVPPIGRYSSPMRP